MIVYLVFQVVFEGLANYEKNPGASPSTLFGTLMMLKAACVNNASYIDRLITPFMRVLQRMAREHITPSPPHETSPGEYLTNIRLSFCCCEDSS
jgi:hypothetical protein